MPATAARSSLPHPAARVLRLVGVIVLLATLAFWATAGAHRGWTQNRVPVSKTDAVTGLTYVEYEDRFVPGVDVLAAGAGLGLVVALSSLFLRRRA
jgi:hypothetical protein